MVWYGPRVLGAHLAGPGLLRNVLLGVGWGVAFHHYLVDARIWRLRRAPAVARAIDGGAVRQRPIVKTAPIWQDGVGAIAGARLSRGRDHRTPTSPWWAAG